MGWRFRKSKQLLPGVRLNINKKSFSLSFGRKGMRYTVNSNGKKTVSAGIPGTGLYYTKSSSGKRLVPSEESKKQSKRKSLDKYVYFLMLSILIAYSSFLYATTLIGIVPFFFSVFFGSYSTVALIDGIKERRTLLRKSEETDIPILKKELRSIHFFLVMGIIISIFFCISLYNDKKESDLIHAEIHERFINDSEEQNTIVNNHVDSTVVYVTETGKKYHLEDCSSLKDSKIELSLDDAIASYEPCSKCNPPTAS